MPSKLIRIFAAIAFISLLSGFGAGTPIYNVASASMPSHPAATMQTLEMAVIRAGAGLGWKITPQGPGKAEGLLILRTHTAIVDIVYDLKSFSITYRSSINLSYRESDKTIHSNYNGWIQNLEKAIKVQAALP